jgi:hypothetical protein
VCFRAHCCTLGDIIQRVCWAVWVCGGKRAGYAAEANQRAQTAATQGQTGLQNVLFG